MENIFLIGPMGAGKSAVGRQLANDLQLDFYDSDEIIEIRTGVDISYIFEKEGQDGFRKREAAIIEELTELDNIVLATGGGVAENLNSRSLLAKRGIVIYLYTSVVQQVERTRKSRNRPLLNNANPLEVLENLMSIRDPQYREIANLVVETDGRKVSAVAKEINQWLGSR
ncbi:MAG: shikimate kinase AroK [Pseudomonadota bacterium]|nr:shikimate kinase AroK [Pseudomonadota bacterium]